MSDAYTSMTVADRQDPSKHSITVCLAMGRFCDRMALRHTDQAAGWRAEAKRWRDGARAQVDQ